MPCFFRIQSPRHRPQLDVVVLDVVVLDVVMHDLVQLDIVLV